MLYNHLYLDKNVLGLLVILNMIYVMSHWYLQFFFNWVFILDFIELLIFCYINKALKANNADTQVLGPNTFTSWGTNCVKTL